MLQNSLIQKYEFIRWTKSDTVKIVLRDIHTYVYMPKILQIYENGLHLFRVKWLINSKIT